jgi:hypothetical protein
MHERQLLFQGHAAEEGLNLLIRRLFGGEESGCENN